VFRAELFAALAFALAIASTAGCGDDGSCIEGLNVDCEPLYEPTFSNLHSRTLGSICGSNAVCHGGSSPQLGLSLAEPDRAHQLLTEGGRLVKPGDPACSVLMIRLESSDPSFVMPPGRQLSEAERCVVRRWIAAGAAR
jgi:hypothetical protein